MHAEQVIIEINRRHSTSLPEMADTAVLPPPLRRNPIPIHHPLTKIGWPYALVEPNKIIGWVETDEPDNVAPFTAPDKVSERMAENVVRFPISEMREGRIPREFLPLQSGVGNVANAVMMTLGQSPDIPAFTMYSEVFQDANVELM
jgi:acetyl-CoA hydrolase